MDQPRGSRRRRVDLAACRARVAGSSQLRRRGIPRRSCTCLYRLLWLPQCEPQTNVSCNTFRSQPASLSCAVSISSRNPSTTTTYRRRTSSRSSWRGSEPRRSQSCLSHCQMFSSCPRTSPPFGCQTSSSSIFPPEWTPTTIRGLHLATSSAT